MIVVKIETEQELVEAANIFYYDKCGDRDGVDDYLNFFGPDYYAIWLDSDDGGLTYYVSGMIVRDKLSALSQQKKQIDSDVNSLLDYV